MISKRYGAKIFKSLHMPPNKSSLQHTYVEDTLLLHVMIYTVGILVILESNYKDLMQQMSSH